MVQRSSQSWHYDAGSNCLTLRLELGHSTVGSGVLPADAAAKGALELVADDRYPLTDEYGRQHGSLWRSESFGALGGLGTFLAHTFAEPGDYLVVTFDLDAKTARALIGGSELFDEPRG
jgi:hypothetical protein